MQPRPTYDEKLLRILRESAAVFAEKGYHRASVRDISAATGVSLSGLYYYFRSKEELLFLIQDHCFGTLLARLTTDLDSLADPEARLRVFVGNHLRFFVSNMEEMKVLSHEADVLTGRYRDAVADKKRRYVEEASAILAEIRPESGAALRTATFALFGMMNWVYTWYRPGKDPEVEELVEEVVHLFLKGFRAPKDPGMGNVVLEGSDDSAPSIWRTT